MLASVPVSTVDCYCTEETTVNKNCLKAVLIRIHKIFFRIRIRILTTYILGQTIPKFFFNGLQTFSEYNTTKKNFFYLWKYVRFFI
jgi:hypothetical protein